MAEQQVQTQHPIPQQVLGIQFKLIGELTLRQFVVLALFGGLAYVIFSTPAINALLRLPLAAIILLLGVAFSLVPIQDQPLDRWIGNFFQAIFSPTRRVWQKIPEPPEFLVIPLPKLAVTVEERISPEEARRRLETYLATVREREALSPLDLAERQQLEFINLELQEAAPSEVAAPPPRQFFPRRRLEEAKREPTLASTINYAVEPFVKVQRGEQITYISALRNVRVGRRLTYAPAAEVVFAPARERVIEPALPEPSPLLRQSLEERMPPTITEAPRKERPKPPPVPSEAPKRHRGGEVEGPVPSKVEGLLPRPPAPERPTPAETIPALRPPPKPLPPETTETLRRMEAQKERKPSPPPKIKPIIPREPEKREPPPLPPPVGEANVIAGTVYDEKGRTIEGALVAIKNQAGITIRAAKTNQLGQFSLSPLPNGSYSVELPRAKLPFAIMRVGLTGRIIPPLEMRART